MLRQRLLPFLVIAVVCGATTAHADVTNEDLFLLGLMFRSRYPIYAKQPDANPAVKEIAGWAQRNLAAPPTERYKQLIKGVTLMAYGKWDEGLEVATILDMRVPAKLSEPGATVKVKVFPLYERSEPIKESYTVQVRLLDALGKVVGAPRQVDYDKLVAQEISLDIPADLAVGRYGVEYALKPHQSDKPAILTAQRHIFVIKGLKNRLDALERELAEIKQKGIADKSKRHKLAADTITWHLGMYQQAAREYVPGTYQGHPIFMHAIVMQTMARGERMDFINEISLPEGLADDLLAGKDPLRTRAGDMRLAYASPVDGELVPFRIFIPEGFDPDKTYPLVLCLHGAGGDENAYMSDFYGIKPVAQKRGYVVVTANGREPYGRYLGKNGQDPLDVLDLVQEVYPINKKRTYLTGHSMGGFGTILLGFNHPEKFAALAAVAGFGLPAQLSKAKDMPLLITQGDEDTLVPVENARNFYKAAQDLGMPHVKYVELKGVDHLRIGPLTINDVFDWFDQHSR